MTKIVRLQTEKEYTVNSFDDIVIAEGDHQKIIIPEEREVEVLLRGQDVEVECRGGKCRIYTGTEAESKITLIGSFNYVVCGGSCIVIVKGIGNHIVVIGPYPSIHCEGNCCTVSGELDCAEVDFHKAEECIAVSNGSIAYLVPGRRTKAIAGQYVYCEGEKLTEGQVYEIEGPYLTKLDESGFPL